MMWHTSRIVRRILSKWPHYRGPCKYKHMQSCSSDLSLSHLGVTSSLGLLWICSIFLHTTHMCECEFLGACTPLEPSLVKLLYNNAQRSAEPLGVMLSMNTLIIILCASTLIVSRKVSLCKNIQHAWGLSDFHLISLLTQPSNLMSLLHLISSLCYIK